MKDEKTGRPLACMIPTRRVVATPDQLTNVQRQHSSLVSKAGLQVLPVTVSHFGKTAAWLTFDLKGAQYDALLPVGER